SNFRFYRCVTGQYFPSVRIGNSVGLFAHLPFRKLRSIRGLTTDVTSSLFTILGPRAVRRCKCVVVRGWSADLSHSASCWAYLCTLARLQLHSENRGNDCPSVYLVLWIFFRNKKHPCNLCHYFPRRLFFEQIQTQAFACVVSGGAHSCSIDVGDEL